MIRKLRRSSLLSMILAIAIMIAWIQSHFVGWETTWSNAEGKHAGRIVSSQGQIFFQRCSLKPSWGVTTLAKESDVMVMPQNFHVGSNATGKQKNLEIADLTIPFTEPNPWSFIGFHGQSTMESQHAEGTYWIAMWHEILVSYWFVLLLLFLQPLLQCGQWLLRRFGQPVSDESAKLNSP